MGLTAYETKSLPDMSDVSGSMMATTVAAMLLANAALMSLTSGGRKVVSNAIEAVITFVLLIVLILLVLGVPVGFMYTGFLVVKYAWIFRRPLPLAVRLPVRRRGHRLRQGQASLNLATIMRHKHSRTRH